MKKVAPPKSNILIMRYRKPRKISFFDKSYVAPHGYSLIAMTHGKDIRQLPHIGGKVSGSNAIYLVKMRFDITWGVGKLICEMENGNLSHEFGLNGVVGFEVKYPVEFFEKLNGITTNKILVDDFKNLWLKHWGSLLQQTFSNNSIGYRQASQVVTSLRDTIDAEMTISYSCAVVQLSTKDTNRV